MNPNRIFPVSRKQSMKTSYCKLLVVANNSYDNDALAKEMRWQFKLLTNCKLSIRELNLINYGEEGKIRY